MKRWRQIPIVWKHRRDELRFCVKYANVVEAIRNSRWCPDDGWVLSLRHEGLPEYAGVQRSIAKEAVFLRFRLPCLDMAVINIS